MFKSLSYFVLAGVLEIGGGYFIWLCFREEKGYAWCWAERLRLWV
ncbi:hypothetical protein [Sulfurospirillum deleyianum]